MSDRMKPTRVNTEKIMQIFQRFVGHPVHLVFPDDPDYDDKAERLMRICKRRGDKWRIKQISHAWTNRKPLIVIFLKEGDDMHRAMVFTLDFYQIESSRFFMLLVTKDLAKGLRDKDDSEGEYTRVSYQFAVASALSKRFVIVWDDRVSDEDRQFILEHLKGLPGNVIFQETVSFKSRSREEAIRLMKKLEALEASEVK